jgi:hypothetical protein
VTKVHEREEAYGGNGAQFLCPSVERAREREREQGASEGECGVVVPLKPSRPDWWGPYRRTVATARSRVGAGLRPVGHTDGSEL